MCASRPVSFPDDCRSITDDCLLSLRLNQHFPYPCTRTMSIKHTIPAGMKKHLSKTSAGIYVTVVGVGVCVLVSWRKSAKYFPIRVAAHKPSPCQRHLTKLSRENTFFNAKHLNVKLPTRNAVLQLG